MVMPNKAANTITVRATAPVVDVIDRIIRANDKPRAEVVLDVEILEVDRERIKRYGINLSSYSLNLIFSPELAPPNVAGGGVSAPPPFNLNTISQGVSTADFYLGVPTAIVNFLESDSHSRTLAKPQLRGTEGQKMTLNLGQQVPVISTVFGAAAAGGFATIPQSSYNYKDVGVNMDITPRVTYEGEVILELSLENSSIGQNVDVAGQSIPSFNSRKVSTHLRLREGESNLLAGLIGEDERKAIQGLPGLIHVPGFKQVLSGNDIDIKNTDIVMLITPHIVRTHELTSTDLGSIYIGTQQNVGLGGPPPLIAPQPETPGGTTGTAPSGTTGISGQPPNFPPGGVPSPGGVPPTNVPAPPGTSPVPGPIAPVQTLPAPGLPPPTPAGEGGVPTTTGQPPVTPAPVEAAPTTTPPAGQTAGSPSTPAQVIVSPPGTTFQVAGGPYTMPVSINNASRISVVTLTITYNPAVLRVRTVQDGTFMRQGGVIASFTPRIDAASGRVDIAISRTGDQTGVSGAGLLAALIFDAIAPGGSVISVNGVANTPEGTPVQLTFSPVTVTVR
jgi:general secretion pathway protein D